MKKKEKLSPINALVEKLKGPQLAEAINQVKEMFSQLKGENEELRNKNKTLEAEKKEIKGVMAKAAELSSEVGMLLIQTYNLKPENEVKSSFELNEIIQDINEIEKSKIVPETIIDGLNRQMKTIWHLNNVLDRIKDINNFIAQKEGINNQYTLKTIKQWMNNNEFQQSKDVADSVKKVAHSYSYAISNLEQKIQIAEKQLKE